MGNTLSADACKRTRVFPECSRRRSRGIAVQTTEDTGFAVLGDYASARERPEEAVAERGRPAGAGKILWYREDGDPPDSRVCLSQPIAKPGRARLVCVESNPAYGLNGVLLNPHADCGAMDGCRALLRPCAYLAGLHLEDCLRHWLVSPDADAPRE